MAANAYRDQSSDKKRELIKLVVSNLEWKEGMLSYEFREPFDIISKIKTLKPRRVDTEKAKSAKNKIWWRRRESNPKYYVFSILFIINKI